MACRFENRTKLRPVRDELWKLNHEVVSTWIDETKKPEGMSEDIFKKKLAVKDLAEIKSANLFALDTEVPSDRGGKEVEFGLALGGFQSKLVYVVGPLRNVFHYLCDRQFETWDDFIKYMREQGEVV